MNRLEQELKKEKRTSLVQQIIIKTVATGGLLSVALVAPNALQMFGKLGWLKTKFPRSDSFNRSFDRLINADLIYLEKTPRGKFARLTDKGYSLLAKVERNNYKLEKPKKWDKKWRIIVFDISEKRKKVRDKLRATLVSIGFVHMQHSVWVYPYDCEDLINLLKADFMIGKDVLYVIADKIENDKWLRSHFELL